MTRIVTFALMLSCACVAAAQDVRPLQEAAREATVLCYAVDRENSLDECSFMGGRTPEHFAARKAMRSVYIQRDSFLRSCTPMRGITCAEYAELQIGAGQWAGWKELGLVR